MRFWRRYSPGRVIGMTLPRRTGDPGAAEGAELGCGRLRAGGICEEPVERRARPAHVGAERTELGEARRERRGGEVVRRHGREVARGHRLEQLRAPLLE